MAILTDRLVNVREGWLTLDVTWDDTNGRVQQIRIECHAPNPIHIALFRGGSSQPWREATLSDGQVYDESRPFGGGFNTLDQIAGVSFEVIF